MTRLLSILLTLAFLTAASSAAAVGKKALVIGNGVYDNGMDLKNPVGDARAVAAALEFQEFEVTYAENQSLKDMTALLARFSRTLGTGDIVVVFFGGHGVQVRGATYLLPTDAMMRDTHDLVTALALNDILKVLKEDLRSVLVIVDACRDNPIIAAHATRSPNGGASIAGPRMDLPFGMVIGYAAQPGAVAYDGAGRHSPYVTALLRHLETPGQDVELMLRAVRKDVVLATGGAQLPWTQSSLLDGFSLSSPDGRPAEPARLDPRREARRVLLRAKLCGAMQRRNPGACAVAGDDG
ncbi:MAG: caspase family protein [Pseudomonadota bacterium]